MRSNIRRRRANCLLRASSRSVVVIILSLLLLLLSSSSSSSRRGTTTTQHYYGVLVAGAEITDTDNNGDWKAKVDNESQSSLFKPSSYIKVSGPTMFPKPTRKVLSNNATKYTTEPIPIVTPIFGRHRPDRDAVLAYAEGYALPVYMMFIETLKSTGYKGDVVLAIADERIIQPNVIEYLKLYSLPSESLSSVEEEDRLAVVVYQVPLYCKSTTNDDDGSDNGERRVMKQGGTDVFQQCQLNDVYGWKDKDGNIIEKAKDPRGGRPVATVRYEFYWIWSLQYNPNSWIMLLDARDSYFQTNPFVNLPRDSDNNNNNNKKKRDGLLYFFGENPDATRLGKSTKNLKWLRNGYGDFVLDALKSKPTICSGSTMGEQIAIETYLRALVNEHDECHIKMTGSDQGFHNYLYYSGKLLHATTIRKIIVWEQGRGIINNLGALRTKPFAEWGFYNPQSHEVFQWDGRTLSPVVHQWDRDNHLHKYMFKQKQKQWQKDWDNGKYTKQER